MRVRVEMTHALGMDKARGWRTKSVCSDLSVYSEEPSTPLASRMFDREKQLGARPGGDGEGEGEGSSEGEEGGGVGVPEGTGERCR